MNEVSLKPVIEELESLFSKFNTRFFAGELEKPGDHRFPGSYPWGLRMVYQLEGLAERSQGRRLNKNENFCRAFEIRNG